MIRKVALVLSLILSATYMFAQSGRLSGMVTDKSNNEEISLCKCGGVTKWNSENGCSIRF